MQNSIRVSIKALWAACLLSAVFSVGACTQRIAPARVIPPGDDNTRLCKESYLECRSRCASTHDEETRMSCADTCERDVDTCLLQSRVD